MSSRSSDLKAASAITCCAHARKLGLGAALVCRHPEVMALVLLGRRRKSVVHCTIRIGHLISVPDRTDVRLVAGRVARSCDGPPRRACRMELAGPAMRPACPTRPRSSPGCPSQTERARDGSHGRHASARLRPALLSGRSASRSVVGEWSTDVRRSHWSSSSSSWPPAREADGRPGASRLLRKARRGRGRRARGLLDLRHSAVRRARPERELDVRHGEVAANEVWRGRRGRRRNRTEGARCKEAVPAGSADCDRHADSDGDCPRQRPAPTPPPWRRKRVAPHHVRPSACRARPRRGTQGRTRRGRRCSAPAGRPARRRARAASRPPRTSLQRMGRALKHAGRLCSGSAPAGDHHDDERQLRTRRHHAEVRDQQPDGRRRRRTARGRSAASSIFTPADVR